MKSFKEFNEKIEEPSGDLKKACWKGYTAVGMKMKKGKKVPNCVPEDVEEVVEEKNPTTIKLPVAEKILKKAGYALDRVGKHRVWKHSDSTKPHFALPAHPSKDISPALTRNLFSMAESFDIDINEE